MNTTEGLASLCRVFFQKKLILTLCDKMGMYILGVIQREWLFPFCKFGIFGESWQKLKRRI